MTLVPACEFSDKTSKVYLYGTCLIDSLYPDSGMDAIALLAHFGVEVIFPQGQSCCGQPAYNAGYSDQAKAVAQAQMALFAEPIPIVVLSGSCGGMMRHHYLQLLPQQPQLADFCSRIFELSEFLTQVLNVKLQDRGQPISIALHTSCAARREMNSHTYCRQLLAQLSEVTLVEHAYESECCGFGGTFAIKHGDISSAMVQDKCRHLCATGVQRYVSADWGCMMNINGALEYQGETLSGQHIASFLLERLSGA